MKIMTSPKRRTPPTKRKVKLLQPKEYCAFEVNEVKAPNKETQIAITFFIPSYLVPDAVKKRRKK
jgi:hypothetical protein